MIQDPFEDQQRRRHQQEQQRTDHLFVLSALPRNGDQMHNACRHHAANPYFRRIEQRTVCILSVFDDRFLIRRSQYKRHAVQVICQDPAYEQQRRNRQIFPESALLCGGIAAVETDHQEQRRDQDDRHVIEIPA